MKLCGSGESPSITESLGLPSVMPFNARSPGKLPPNRYRKALNRPHPILHPSPKNDLEMEHCPARVGR